ncbi:DsbC family protein [Acinetobacter sp. MD2]|uniref:DsbC family protein n=1 Tax=Acinetobacter sp. MD2 TaxID=2600066 RepID=UPI002D1EE86F|nr:DsbC family protein [Acinetobacter sp. MD2]MEB3767969.1 DsbC family protein [Acinetobacter sp. MD2]
MNMTLKACLSALSFSLCSISLAHADTNTVTQNIKKNFPDIQVQSVNNTPIPNIYEVYMDGEIVYTNDDARYFFLGNLVDLKNKTNLTAERQQELSKIDVKTLPLQQAIKQVKGNGKRVIYLFSDPDCPYCHELEKELQQVDNVTIYLFLFPLTSLHPNAQNIATQVWCSKKPYQAWENYVLHGKQPNASTTCTTPIQKNLNLGKQLQIDSTPTFFLQNGHRISGARSVSEINQLLDDAAK